MSCFLRISLVFYCIWLNCLDWLNSGCDFIFAVLSLLRLNWQPELTGIVVALLSLRFLQLISRKIHSYLLSSHAALIWPVFLLGRTNRWGCPPSKFPWTYSSKETCYLLEGKVKVTPEGANEAVEIGAGDLVVFPKGMSCTWDVSVAVDKHYNFE